MPPQDRVGGHNRADLAEQPAAQADSFRCESPALRIGQPQAASVQLLFEDKNPSDAVVAKVASMAATEPSPVARLHVAASLQRMDAKHRWTVAKGLLSHAEDADDHVIPKLIWYGLHSTVMSDVKTALMTAGAGKIPLITKFVARRMAHGNAPARPPALSTKKAMRKVAQGFNVVASGEGGVRFESKFRNRYAVRTHPVDKKTPSILKRKVRAKDFKGKGLHLEVSHHPHGDWRLVVRVNKKVMADRIVSSKTVNYKGEWLEFDVDLSEFEGKDIIIQLENWPTGWHNEFAYWHQINVRKLKK